MNNTNITFLSSIFKEEDFNKAKNDCLRHINNLEESGFLFGLTGDEKDIVLSNYKRVNVDKIANPRTFEVILPCIRYSLSLVLHPESQFRIFQKKPNLINRALYFYSVDDIIEKLDKINLELTPEMKKILPNLDYEAELVQLFCKDYAFGIVKKIQSEEN